MKKKTERLVMMLLCFVLLNGLVFFSSLLYACDPRGENRPGFLLLTASIFFAAQISITALFAGIVLRQLNPLFLTLLNLLISGGVLAVFWNRIPALWRRLSEGLRQTGADVLKTGNLLIILLIILFLAEAAAILVKIRHLPPGVWDVYTYHLHPAAEWLRQGQIPSVIDTPVLRANTNPLGAHLFHYWIVAFTGELTWIELPQFMGGLLLALAVYVMMRQMKVSSPWALTWALAAWFTPAVLIQSRTCQDHLLLAAFICSAACCFLEMFIRRDSPPILPLCLSLGLILGVKQNSPLILAVFLAAALISGGIRRRDVLAIKTHWRRWLGGLSLGLAIGGYWFLREGALFKKYLQMAGRVDWVKPALLLAPAGLLLWGAATLAKGRKWPLMSVRGKKNVLAGLCVCLAIGAGWSAIRSGWAPLVKTALKTTSPLPASQLEGLSPLVQNLLSLPLRIKDTAAPYSADSDNISGFGPLFAAFGIPAFLAAPFFMFRRSGWRREKEREGQPNISDDLSDTVCVRFLFLLPLFLVFSTFLYYSSRFSYRMYIFWPALGMALWGVLGEKLDWPVFSRRVLELLAVMLAVFCGITTFWEGDLRPQQWKTLMTMRDPGSRTMAEFSPLLDSPDFHFLDRYAAPDEPVAFSGGLDTWVFPLFDHRLKRPVIYLNTLKEFRAVTDPVNPKGPRFIHFDGSLRKALRQKGIHLIYLPKQGCLPWQVLRFRENEKKIIPLTENLFYFDF